MEKYDIEAYMNNQASPEKKTGWLGTAQVSKKRRGIFVPEEKRVGKYIKEKRNLKCPKYG